MDSHVTLSPEQFDSLCGQVEQTARARLRREVDTTVKDIVAVFRSLVQSAIPNSADKIKLALPLVSSDTATKSVVDLLTEETLSTAAKQPATNRQITESPSGDLLVNLSAFLSTDTGLTEASAISDHPDDPVVSAAGDQNHHTLSTFTSTEDVNTVQELDTTVDFGIQQLLTAARSKKLEDKPSETAPKQNAAGAVSPNRNDSDAMNKRILTASTSANDDEFLVVNNVINDSVGSNVEASANIDKPENNDPSSVNGDANTSSGSLKRYLPKEEFVTPVPQKRQKAVNKHSIVTSNINQATKSWKSLEHYRRVHLFNDNGSNIAKDGHPIYKFVTINTICPENGCSKVLTTKDDYNRHLKYKHSVLLFKCPLNKCSHSFKRRTDLELHFIQAHRNVRNWRCGKCTLVFKDPNSLHSHLYSNHYEGRFKCLLLDCDFYAKHRCSVNTHYQRVHRNAVPPPAPVPLVQFPYQQMPQTPPQWPMPYYDDPFHYDCIPNESPTMFAFPSQHVSSDYEPYTPMSGPSISFDRSFGDFDLRRLMSSVGPQSSTTTSTTILPLPPPMFNPTMPYRTVINMEYSDLYQPQPMH